MQQRLKTLRRIKSLYAAVEAMDSIDLKQKTAALIEAQDALATEKETLWSNYVERRKALRVGDSAGRTLAETQCEITQLRRQILEKIRQDRERLNEAAREQYVASRLNAQQMNEVVNDIEMAADVDKERKIQAALDDGFLARRRWTDAREQLRDSSSR